VSKGAFGQILVAVDRDDSGAAFVAINHGNMTAALSEEFEAGPLERLD